MVKMYDVLIAGAGPVGLFLACELGLGGCSVLVLEKATDPASPLKRLPFGMRGLSATSLDAFHRRGLLDQISTGQPHDIRKVGHWMQQARRPVGHFAGIQFFEENIESTRWPYYLPGPGGLGMPTTLEHLEAELARRAEELGVELRRGVDVASVDQSAGEVVVGAGNETFRGRWLVGCDGGRSIGRKAGGFGFSGTDPEFTAYSVEVELSDPDALQPGQHVTATGVYVYAKPGVMTIAEFDGGAHHRTEPIKREHIEALLRRVSGIDVDVQALRLSTTWTDRAFQAETYRRERVLLAGDAAHIHSPLGGQGLNLGLGDALNLGWKLAAVIRGDAPAGLLDSYEIERHPVAAQVLDWSRAQVALMRPEPASRALAAILRDVIATRDGASYFAERKSGVSLRYDLGGDDPLVGRSAPDILFTGGALLGELLRDGRAILLDFSHDATLASIQDLFGSRLRYLAAEAEEHFGISAMFVRPDGIVAWATEMVPAPKEARIAISRWVEENQS
ncbi:MULTISPECIES: FAD-dependent monooxygenase [unclassified Novosphingobium]|uniref:FAD-dependent monooxygenase n=1 Tax=unclassified Novosphingobium TaxID=2644732 RepID=UPI001494C8A8|nr:MULTISPECIES: FAD-dependent monooxygenase [unclassified Novosphingobium]MBB3356986.1 2-polyprenyl-6-methoxyphenol hydroxylase-like FAD-dependent oxidoreductase [Novosphingobium sp. BK256]MBB3373387.1 2-polyprenyl-6-methoxyphenol hydroxylase-like FAD-dependent oxidoreductase [Novosphingobium sp. BK280]MBB3377756.1 2-polyprenyl-6-methoxyphenol hydroxylase-like FAD-dependent oxidoreductase [Novosphingobium sp. BK258]MBB3418833.1 2-polyprenyl-6-methoxyphenol hydroxylase-like FAD-dependent oxidor